MDTLALHIGCPEPRLGARDSPHRPLVWPWGSGSSPFPQAGMEQTPAGGPHTRRPPAPLELRCFDVAGPGREGQEVRGHAPRARLGVSPRPCRTRSPAPQLGGHLKAPVSFLLCKSPNFLISCFAPSCNGTCRYVTSIIKIPPSKRHCALQEAGRGNCSYLSSARENQVQSSQSWSLKYSWGGGACSQGPSHQVTLLWAHSMQVLWWSCSCTK